MRKLMLIVFVLLLAVPSWAAEIQTEDQKTLYAIGAHMSKQLAVFNLTADEFAIVKQGMEEAAAGKKLAAEPEAYMQKINQLAQARIQVAAEKEKEQSKPYLEKAASEKDARKLPSGVIYQEIKAGSGAQPKATDIVKVHYTGSLVNGKVFDSSVQRGQPADFPLNQVIPCWTEGVGMMKVGGKAKLTCPSDSAYGDRGRPSAIPGGATLVFDVELLEVKAPEAPAAAPKTPAAPKKSSKK
ncbi:MAG: FKBP-type peptidyl-prolyl cis-trans isomerase [Deltaproteobacteria bacterium]